MFRQARAIAIPVIVTVVFPALTLWATRSANVGWGLVSPLHLLPVVAGLALIGVGLYLVVSTIRMFITIGKGTLAPWDPPAKLVVSGIYRRVRNPMISGVTAIVLGEAVLFGSMPLFLFALLFFVTNAVYIPLSEEPGLRRRFGADYDEYTRNVPRWIPRASPWIQQGK